MAHNKNKNEGVLEQGGTESFDITFYNKDPDDGGVPTNPDGYTPGSGPNFNDPSGEVSVTIAIYDSGSDTFSTPPGSYNTPTTSNLEYGGTTGKFTVDVTAPSDAKLTTDLGTNEQWAIYWDTTINGISLTSPTTAETFEVVASGAATFGNNLYCTPDDVSQFMTANKFPFDDNTPMTDEDVEDYIEAATEDVERITKKYWRPKTITQELRDIQPNTRWGAWGGDYYASFKLRHNPIDSVQKLELFIGASYDDITDRQGRGNDWFVDKDRGVIYLRRGLMTYVLRNGARVNYTYKQPESLPANVKQATVMLAAWHILQSEDFSLLFPEGSEHIRILEKSHEWKQRAKEMLWSERRTVYLV